MSPMTTDTRGEGQAFTPLYPLRRYRLAVGIALCHDPVHATAIRVIVIPGTGTESVPYISQDVVPGVTVVSGGCEGLCEGACRGPGMPKPSIPPWPRTKPPGPPGK